MSNRLHKTCFIPACHLPWSQATKQRIEDNYKGIRSKRSKKYLIIKMADKDNTSDWINQITEVSTVGHTIISIDCCILPTKRCCSTNLKKWCVDHHSATFFVSFVILFSNPLYSTLTMGNNSETSCFCTILLGFRAV